LDLGAELVAERGSGTSPDSVEGVGVRDAPPLSNERSIAAFTYGTCRRPSRGRVDPPPAASEDDELAVGDAPAAGDIGAGRRSGAAARPSGVSCVFPDTLGVCPWT
jgi:hypothetical protein